MNEPLQQTDPITIESWLSEGDERGWPTTCSTASPGRSRSCRRSTSTTAAARSCSSRSASCPSTTRPAPRRRSSTQRAAEIVALTGAGELVELGSGAADKARVLLDAMAEAGTLRRYVPLRRLRERRARCRRSSWSTDYHGLRVHGVDR